MVFSDLPDQRDTQSNIAPRFVGGIDAQLGDGARLPLSTIDGISSRAALELKHFDVDDVSVLATSNPFYLFCETSFGLYQIADWIAQAQLLAALGKQRVDRLNKIGITSVDALKDLYENHPLAREAISDALQFEDSNVGTIVNAITNTSHFRRLEMLQRIPPDMIDMLLDAAQKMKDSNPNRVWRSLVGPLQRFVHQSIFIIPCSLVVVVWSIFQIQINLIPAFQILADIAFPSAVAQEATQSRLFMSQTLQSLIMVGIASSILITLLVCLYAGFISKKPSAKAAELVKSILSFAFGIMTGSIATGR